MGKLEDYAGRLLRGEDGAAVVGDMRAHYSLKSLSSKVSRVRRLFMDAVPGNGERNTHPDYKEGMRRLRGAVRIQLSGGGGATSLSDRCADWLAEFLKAPLRTKYAMHQRYRRGKTCMPAPGRLAAGGARAANPVHAAVAALKLLPDCMRSFHITRDEHRRTAELNTRARIEKNEQALVVDGPMFMRIAAKVLSSPEKATMADLILALCAVTGRRCTEIASPRSSFAPMPGTKHGAVFGGQLKRGGACPSYRIPLLLPYSTVAAGLAELRRRQGPGLLALTNQQINTRYQGNTSRACKRLFPFVGRVHDLRSCYAAYAYRAFAYKIASSKGGPARPTFNRVAMQILGHTSMDQSLSYNSADVEGVVRGSLGAFPLAQCGPGGCVDNKQKKMKQL